MATLETKIPNDSLFLLVMTYLRIASEFSPGLAGELAEARHFGITGADIRHADDGLAVSLHYSPIIGGGS